MSAPILSDTEIPTRYPGADTHKIPEWTVEYAGPAISRLRSRMWQDYVWDWRLGNVEIQCEGLTSVRDGGEGGEAGANSKDIA